MIHFLKISQNKIKYFSLAKKNRKFSRRQKSNHAKIKNPKKFFKDFLRDNFRV